MTICLKTGAQIIILRTEIRLDLEKVLKPRNSRSAILLIIKITIYSIKIIKVWPKEFKIIVKFYDRNFRNWP